MILVVARAMLLGFLRDRGAVVMALVLPIAVFVVFAAIFTGTSGEHLRVTVAVADEARSEESARLVRALARDPALTLRPEASMAEVRRVVRQGSADAGLIIRKGGRALDDLAGGGPAPLVIVTDPVRAVAARVLAGQIQHVYFAALSDVALGGVARLLTDGFVTLEPAQERQLASELETLRQGMLAAEAAGASPANPLEALLDEETTVPAVGRSHVAYYAGAVSMLFLLFAAVHGALTVLEERDSALLDRVLAGPGGMGAVIAGKFLFLVVQGVVQVTVIFLLAWALYEVDLPTHLGAYAIVTVAAASAAAGLALALTTACSTQRQAQTLANVVVLIASAVGGSMVPRFFMPPLMQHLGWLTPTAWALEAYTSIFWRHDSLARIVLPVVLLVATGVIGWVIARRAARRFEMI